MNIRSLLFSPLLLLTPLAAQGSQNMTLLAHIPGVPCATGGLWAIGNDYVLVGQRSQGFSVIDIRNPSAPVVSQITPPTYPRGVSSYGVGEVKFDGRYIFATNEDFYFGNTGGVFLYDTVPDPMNPTLVLNFQPPELQGGVHNIWVEGNHMYCVSDGTSMIEVYDITNRLAPVHVSTLGQGIPSVWAHDVIVKDNRAYCSLLTAGFAIYDVTNPASPVLLGRRTYSNDFTHNAWPTDDRNYLYTTDENIVAGVGGFVRIWDISNPANIVQVNTWRAGATSSIVHNVHVYGDLLFVSYYKEGVRVLSLLPDPTNPVEIAHYDTFPASQTPCFPNPNYAGCWGVYPFNHNLVVASDLDNGVFLLRLDAVTHTFTATPNPVSGGQTLNLSLTYTNGTAGVVDCFGALIATKVATIPVFSPLLLDLRRLNPGQNRNVALPIPVPPGLPPGLSIDFTAWSGTVNGFTLDQVTTIPVVAQ